MRIEIEALDDQLELLERIRGLEKLVREHLGTFPVTFETNYDYNYLANVFANLEWDCKKWILGTQVLNPRLGDVRKVIFDKTCDNTNRRS